MTPFSQTIPVLRTFYAKNSIDRGNLATQSRFHSFRYETRVARATHFRYSGRVPSATSEVARFELRIRVSCRSASREETHGEDHIPVLWLFRGNEQLSYTRSDFQLFFRDRIRAFSREWKISFASVSGQRNRDTFRTEWCTMFFTEERGEYGIYSGSENYSNTCRRILFMKFHPFRILPTESR